MSRLLAAQQLRVKARTAHAELVDDNIKVSAERDLLSAELADTKAELQALKAMAPAEPQGALG